LLYVIYNVTKHILVLQLTIHHCLYSPKKLLSIDKPTTEAIPYEMYPSGPPQIVWESDEFKEIYDKIML
jgi:hypothetical protein